MISDSVVILYRYHQPSNLDLKKYSSSSELDSGDCITTDSLTRP